MVRTHRQTDRHTDRLLHINFFGHAEVVASGLTLLQPIIKTKWLRTRDVYGDKMLCAHGVYADRMLRAHRGF